MYNLKPQDRTRSRLTERSIGKKRQFGASIMELMVGITIGLLVVLAALGSLVYTHLSSTTMVDATRLQQKADTAFRIINAQTVQAGAIELVPTTLSPSTVVFSTKYTGFDPSITTLATNIVSIHGIDENGVNRDVLRISYQDENSKVSRDCLGQLTADATELISVDNVFTYNAATNELLCRGAAAGFDGTAASALPQPILDGVEDFQVTYGIRTVTPVTKIERFQFLNAAQINALPPIADDITNNGGDTAPWARVTAINICLQLRGDMQGNPQPSMQPIASCVDNVTVPNDGRLRRVFRRTFSLRNALL